MDSCELVFHCFRDIPGSLGYDLPVADQVEPEYHGKGQPSTAPAEAIEEERPTGPWSGPGKINTCDSAGYIVYNPQASPETGYQPYSRL